jgi:hypothetical protein
MWTVIHIAPNKISAENLKQALEHEGHLVQLRHLGSDTNIDNHAIEILVPSSEARDAQEAIANQVRRT